MEYGHFHPIPQGMKFGAGKNPVHVSLYPESLPKTPLRINTTSVQPPLSPPRSTIPLANEQGDFSQAGLLSWFPKDLGL